MPIRPAVVAASLLLLLAGCVPSPATPSPAASGKPTSSAPTASAQPTPAPTSAAPAPVAETEPVALGCSDILTAQEIYDYNPNWSLLDGGTPAGGSLAEQALAQQGIACQLVNQSSGSTIDIGVVRFTPAGYAAKVSSVSASSSAASAFDGFFDTTGDGGAAQAFAEPYWVTVSSSGFIEDHDAAELVDAAVSGL